MDANVVSLIVVALLMINLGLGVANWFTYQFGFNLENSVPVTNYSFYSINETTATTTSENLINNPNLETGKPSFHIIRDLIFGLPNFVETMLNAIGFPSALITVIKSAMLTLVVALYTIFVFQLIAGVFS